jgi:hypothetical protein
MRAHGRISIATFGLLALAGFTFAARGQEVQGFDPKAPAVPEFKLTPFYEANLDFVGKEPGDLIRAEAIPAPARASAWRVMYVSRTWDDRLVPVTGIVVAPNGPSAKPRPVLAWAHGTTGGARVCAPSLAENPAQNLVQRSETAPIDYGAPYLTDFLARGCVVVATDYYGLGGPGVHQYIVGNTAARNLLDSVRAADRMKGLDAGSEFAVVGWSQGGHAGIFAGEEQPKYAPEMTNLGVVAIAPGTTTFSKFVNIPHLYVLARAYRDAYFLPPTEFTDEGRKLVDAADEVCITGIFRASLIERRHSSRMT